MPRFPRQTVVYYVGMRRHWQHPEQFDPAPPPTTPIGASRTALSACGAVPSASYGIDEAARARPNPARFGCYPRGRYEADARVSAAMSCSTDTSVARPSRHRSSRACGHADFQKRVWRRWMLSPGATHARVVRGHDARHPASAQAGLAELSTQSPAAHSPATVLYADGPRRAGWRAEAKSGCFCALEVPRRPCFVSRISRCLIAARPASSAAELLSRA